MDNDICLLRLESKISENAVKELPSGKKIEQGFACLPSFEVGKKQECVVAGWGLLDYFDEAFEKVSFKFEINLSDNSLTAEISINVKYCKADKIFFSNFKF